ncbi:Glycerophosphodiester phosphodiesterase domain-containing protein 1 [Fasciola hepatica]|uniref:Glycerophosphodiester phosphodiesterase domain-containing protein 1 n=1 Tax=Fasciola hepatica TaxID=6192 RepID=A0A4E0R023_FASHE|nr:Glycerophosphodiester phosphodiesterase domain-containing protein 1 [Fasciola hepatica]
MLGFAVTVLILYIFTSYTLYLYPKILHQCKKKACFIPRLISHRGGAGERIENTMEAFKNAVALGSDMLELDCHLTKDGEVVVLHDSDLERTTGLKMKVHELTYAELPPYLSDLEIQFKPGHRCIVPSKVNRNILRLEDLFKAFPTVPMNIDLKVDNDLLIAKVAQLTRQYAREKYTIWGSFDATVSEKCKQANQNIARFFPLRPAVWLLLANAIGLSSFFSIPYDYLELPLMPALDNPQFRAAYNLESWKSRVVMRLLHWFIMSPRLFKHLEARGIPVIFWVCNSEKQFKMAFDVGAAGVMTDYPKKLRSFLDRNPDLAVRRSTSQLNGLLTQSAKLPQQIEQQINDTLLTQLAVLHSKRPICRTSTALVHSGGNIPNITD